MLYSERAYFDGDHCHHCAARDEWLRLARIRRQTGAAIERRGRRRLEAFQQTGPVEQFAVVANG